MSWHRTSSAETSAQLLPAHAVSRMDSLHNLQGPSSRNSNFSHFFIDRGMFHYLHYWSPVNTSCFNISGEKLPFIPFINYNNIPAVTFERTNWYTDLFKYSYMINPVSVKSLSIPLAAIYIVIHTNCFFNQVEKG